MSLYFLFFYSEFDLADQVYYFSEKPTTEIEGSNHNWLIIYTWHEDESEDF